MRTLRLPWCPAARSLGDIGVAQRFVLKGRLRTPTHVAATSARQVQEPSAEPMYCERGSREGQHSRPRGRSRANGKTGSAALQFELALMLVSVSRLFEPPGRMKKPIPGWPLVYFVCTVCSLSTSLTQALMVLPTI